MNKLEKLIETLVEAEVGSIDSPIVYVDMDGVIADFNGGVNVNASAQASRDKYLKVLANFPELLHITDDEIKARLKGPQTDPGLKALKKAWNDYRQRKFMMTGNPGFFLNLPVLPGAAEMLRRITELTGKKPSILTAPVDDNPERCAQEKQQWLQNNLSGLYSGFHCTQDKASFATPNSILVDDRTKYTVPFENAGGISILHKNPQDSMARLENILATWGTKP